MGRRWEISEIDLDNKTIEFIPAQGGKPSLFLGKEITITDHIYQTGHCLLPKQEDFLDLTAHQLFMEGREYFQRTQLGENPILSLGQYVCFFPWLGDKVVNTLSILFTMAGFKANAFAGGVEVERAEEKDIWLLLHEWLENGIQLIASQH